MKMRKRLFSVTVMWDIRWLDIHYQGLCPLSGFDDDDDDEDNDVDDDDDKRWSQ